MTSTRAIPEEKCRQAERPGSWSEFQKLLGRR